MATAPDRVRRFGALWVAAIAMQLPLFALGADPVGGFWQAVGSGLVAALVGGAFLLAGRTLPDGGMRRAQIATAVFCGVLWLNALGG